MSVVIGGDTDALLVGSAGATLEAEGTAGSVGCSISIVMVSSAVALSYLRNFVVVRAASAPAFRLRRVFDF